MKFIKSILALAAASLGSATPVVNHRTAANITSHTAIDIPGHTAINITGHAPNNMTKATLTDLPSCTLWETWIHWFVILL